MTGYSCLLSPPADLLSSQRSRPSQCQYARETVCWSSDVQLFVAEEMCCLLKVKYIDLNIKNILKYFLYLKNHHLSHYL